MRAHMRPGTRIRMVFFRYMFLKVLNVFFVVLGVLFLLLILSAAYLFVFDPFDLKPLFRSLGPQAGTEERIPAPQDEAPSAPPSERVAPAPAPSPLPAADRHPLLNAEQEQLLRTFGIDPAKLPKEMTPELEACFAEKLGAPRVEEISKGSQLTAFDVFGGRSCLGL